MELVFWEMMCRPHRMANGYIKFHLPIVTQPDKAIKVLRFFSIFERIFVLIEDTRLRTEDLKVVISGKYKNLNKIIKI